ncbi:NeuD/PglB/VioB family sugar acetyltransferase [Gallibacterium anatis]|uniref:NeuD/PglB/VioB family sugar acetyltransferase n=1 Tax=Gallibacterium anatis TaxID=750 RepID=A0A921L276_9PAST|nr:NeuD/PglB/VioB family sugar acetyltransferase [Gallibacterium anatis]
MLKKVILIGAGGYAKSVLDSLDKTKYEFYGFIDNFQTVGNYHLGYPILANKLEDIDNKEKYSYFISIGNNLNRLKHFLNLSKNNCNIINIIDKSAIISAGAKLGTGIFIGKLAIVNNGTIIGDNVIINTKALIEHGCLVENHSNISTNTTLNGDVIVEKMSFVGSSSVINGQLRIGAGAVVGSGAVVIKNVQPYTVVAGVPAKYIKDVG